MARVVVLISDLLFGSRLQADLSAAGHEVELVGDSEALERRLGGCEVLIVDLADERLRGAELAAELIVGRMRRDDEADRPRTLGFYPHVDVETRERAQRAGFDLVVPRSRMAREGGELVSRLLSSV
jgi:hypothetical protein